MNLSGLDDQHRITEGQEAVLLFDCLVDRVHR